MAGRKVFVDTGAWIALAVSRDQHHERAKTIFEAIIANGSEQITSNLIVSETYTFLRYHVSYNAAVRFLGSIREAEKMRFLHVLYSTPSLENEALGVIRKYRDHALSYVDAVSFVILERQPEITDVFAFDAHFYLTARNVIQV